MTKIEHDLKKVFNFLQIKPGNRNKESYYVEPNIEAFGFPYCATDKMHQKHMEHVLWIKHWAFDCANKAMVKVP